MDPVCQEAAARAVEGSQKGAERAARNCSAMNSATKGLSDDNDDNDDHLTHEQFKADPGHTPDHSSLA